MKLIYLLLTIMIISGCSCSADKENAPEPKSENTDSLPMLVMQIRKHSRLYTAEYRIKKIVTHDDVKRLKGTFLGKQFDMKMPIGDRKIAIPMSAKLKAYIDFSSFKLFLLDVGLLSAMSDLDAKSILIKNNILTEFKGALTEQYVLQQLVADTDYTPYYFTESKSEGEIDFMIQKETNIVPVEVKAEENLRAKSLKTYCEK